MRAIAILVFEAIVCGWTGVGRAADVEFSRDVRPILTRHCFKCHGPDAAQRQADLRLDIRSAALEPAESGERAIVPGEPAASELVRRISSTDAEVVMPPPAVKHPLTEAEIATLRAWIAAGADYQPHWAFKVPEEKPLPPVRQTGWPRNPVDNFVLARLEAAGMAPSPPADRATLARRVSLDLIGLPPTPEEVAGFVADQSPDAYERLVDRLLASPHYGERWARRWLDLARYADTNGYEKDRVRSVWPYRDWVINALNADMPFDQFTVEQLAGDLLPGATPPQRVATGFHRNTMLNEEGGIDPLEFRFYAMVDRVATTGTTWLGLTIGCAQCHTHKYDPIPQTEFYEMMACLNNADEPEMPVPGQGSSEKRLKIMQQIEAAEADLPNRFPVDEWRWFTPSARVVSSAGATIEMPGDGSVRLSGADPERDTYTVQFESDLTDIVALRIEALTDSALPSLGPGRTPHGNFVLSEVTVEIAPRDGSSPPHALKLVRSAADFSQDGFSVDRAIDGDPSTGWAIQGPNPWNLNRTATFQWDAPAGLANGAVWTVRLDQQYGGHHTLGRFRVSLAQAATPTADKTARTERRQAAFTAKFNQWLERNRATAVHWTVLRPRTAGANVPFLTVLDDASVFAAGDQSKRDVYDLQFAVDRQPITAVRLEALPDDRLPRRGPGRIYYEGPPGDFFLSEIRLTADDHPVVLQRASQTFGNAALAIDGDPQSGWSADGQQGRPNAAVFELAEPLSATSALAVQLVCERYYAAGLGRFRIAVTSDKTPVSAHDMPGEIEDLLAKSPADCTAQDRERLIRYFASVAPELAGERAEIARLREQLPSDPTTLVMAERPAEYKRITHRYHRGEFLQPREVVEAGVLSCLPPLPSDQPRNRLSFARWLVNGQNPLVGRVVVNRQWAAIFGRGLVRTTEDFGFQGELPSHPELLDWLAVELVRQGWSLKKLHRLLVTSATYQQSSQVRAEARERDPSNRLLGRAPRFRLDAELVRDAALKASGLLSGKLGGPSVFPPQPAGVTSEGAYGPLDWKTSEGEDRYRRGLYTFAKRTAPYAMFASFDAPTGEACLARREVSNTPLQALTLLNDMVFVEASQALGRFLAAQAVSDNERLDILFERALARLPRGDERTLLLGFYTATRARLAAGEIDAATIAGPVAGERDAITQAAWTLVARVVLNLDEFVTKE